MNYLEHPILRVYVKCDIIFENLPAVLCKYTDLFKPCLFFYSFKAILYDEVNYCNKL